MRKWLCRLFAWCFLAVEGERPTDPARVHLVTFLNSPDRRLAYLQVSSEAYALNPHVIGYGVTAWWPDGLGVKINALRRYVWAHARDRDIVIFADAFDVMVMSGEAEIVANFEQLERTSGRSIVFNCEEVCFPKIDGVCDEASYPQAPHRWRYLNSGLIAGRGLALKSLLRDPVQDVIIGSDQFWYQDYFRHHRDAITLDQNCVLFCAIWGVQPEHGAEMEGSRIRIPVTGTYPSLVHFVGVGHWTRWSDGVASTNLHDVFGDLYPVAAQNLLNQWRLELQIGSTHDIKIYHGDPLWLAMRVVLCVQCNLLGSRERECEYFSGLFCSSCVWIFASLTPCIAALLFLAWRTSRIRVPTSVARQQLCPAFLQRRFSAKKPELVV